MLVKNHQSGHFLSLDYGVRVENYQFFIDPQNLLVHLINCYISGEGSSDILKIALF